MTLTLYNNVPSGPGAYIVFSVRRGFDQIDLKQVPIFRRRNTGVVFNATLRCSVTRNLFEIECGIHKKCVQKTLAHVYSLYRTGILSPCLIRKALNFFQGFLASVCRVAQKLGANLHSKHYPLSVGQTLQT